MKKPYILLVLALSLANIHAAVTAGHPAYDPFADASGSGGTTYAIGSHLIGQTNSQGLTWANAGNSNSVQPTITASNLSVTGLAPSTGNSVSFGPGTPADAGASARLGLGGAITNGTVYYSMAMQLTTITNMTTAAGSFIVAFNNSSGSQTSQPTVLFTRLYLRTNGIGGYNIGLDKSASGPIWSAANFNAGDTVFIVGGYTFNNGSSIDDVSSLWINPDPSTFGAANAPTNDLSTSAGSDITSSQVASLLLRQSSHLEPQTVIDDVRVGVTWADVTPTAGTAPSFSNLTASQSTTYGSTAITLGGTLSAPGPIYPSAGETVSVTINGNTQSTTINDATGDFSFTYNPSTVPVTGSPFPITYYFGGDPLLTTASNATTTLTITPKTAILTGTRFYDGTTDAAASILSVTNKINGDNVTLSSGDATLAGSAVGSQTITSIGTLVLGGTDAANYTLSGASGAVTIISSPLAVVLTGTRPYDGTANASFSILSIANKLNNDDVHLVSGSAVLAGSNYGTESITSPGTLVLGGTTASNYTLSGATGSVSITIGTGAPAFDPFANATANGGTAYNVGDSLIGETNAQGLTWYSAGPTGSGSYPIIASGNLSVPGLVASTGNSVSYGNANGDTARLGLSMTVTNGTLYYSMIVQVSSLGGLTTNGAIIAGFNNSTGAQTTQPSVIGTRLETRLSGSSYNFGVDKSGTGIVWDSGNYNPGDTVFIVGSYTFNSATNTDDVASLWINPSPATFGAGSAPAPTLTSTNGSDITASQIASFLLREASTTEPALTADEVRVGFTWADVTPSSSVPPFSITSETLDGTGNNLIITWQSVPGTSYHVIGAKSLLTPVASWTNVGSPVTASSTLTTTTNSIVKPVNFFEVVSP